MNMTMLMKIKKLKPNEFMILAKIYTDKDFPHNTILLKDVVAELNISKPTASRILKNLADKGLIREIRDFIVVYEPIREKQRNEIKRAIFIRLGILPES